MKYFVKCKMVGEIINDVYVSKRKKAKHFMKNYQGWAIDVDIVLSLIKDCVRSIVLKTDVGDFATTPKFIYENGHKINYGYNEQLVLPERLWKHKDKGQTELFGGK